MDVSTAIRAHSDWKLRLLGWCNPNSHDKIDVPAIRVDNVCELGKWLQAERRSQSAEPELKELEARHRAFHLAAGSIAELIQRGKQTEAKALIIESNSEFSKTSMEVTRLLLALKKRRSGAALQHH